MHAGGMAGGSSRSDGRPVGALFVVNLPFVATSGLATVALTVYDRTVVLSTPFVLAVVVLAGTVALTLLVPWQRLPPRCELAVAVLDLLVTGLFVGAGAPLTLLAVFPVLWLAQRHGRTGVALGVVGGFAVAWIPSALTLPAMTSSQAARVVLVPVVLTAVALSVGAIQRRSDARSLLLQRQGRLLRSAADDLSAERRLLEAVVGTVGVGIVLLDEHGTVVLANRLVVEATDGALHAGATRAALPDVRPTTLDGEAIVPGALDRAIAGEEVRGQVGWWPLPTGRRALRVSVVQLQGHQTGGSGRLAVVTFEDLTEQVSALDLKEDFVAAASHELRTPLTSIVGHLELAVDDPALPDVVRERLVVAERNADRLLVLVDDLLTAASTRAGELVVERAPVDLGAVVLDAVRAIGPIASGAKVSVDAGPGLTGEHAAPAVVGDRARLRQVVDNLLSNAVKYSDAGGRVRVAVEPVGRELVLTVADDGLGIDEADLGHVFTRFYRAGAVRNGPRHGTGLGLHISQQIVQSHGGSIELLSSPGQGTVARVRLPVVGSAP
ncbi:ATP-binding protein [Cellulosimicrobium protaetiae]